jgi:hypothetical protein
MRQLSRWTSVDPVSEIVVPRDIGVYDKCVRRVVEGS